MKSYLFDTSAYSHLARGDARVAKLLRQADAVYVSLVTIAELEYGFENGARTIENKVLLTKFLGSKKVKMLLPDRQVASEFGRIGKRLKACGRLLAHHDLWLVAQAVHSNLELVTFDKDFVYAQGAKIKGFRLKFLETEA